jgi:glycosyltransferase involved in cell wall biosynthesis
MGSLLGIALGGSNPVYSDRNEPSASAGDSDLDPVFYSDFYEDLASLSTEEIERHWRTHGQKEGRHPNVDAMLQRHEAFAGLPEDFDVVDYLCCNGDLTGQFTRSWEVILHYLNHGRLEDRRRKHGEFDAAFIREAYGSLSIGIDKTDWKRRNFPYPLLQWVYGSKRQVLLAHGIENPDEVLGLFDFEYCFYRNLGCTGVYDNKSIARCLVDFCERGIHNGAAIADKFRLDLKFYKKHIFGGQIDHKPKLSPYARTYLHWLNNQPSQSPPNPVLWIEKDAGVLISSYDDLLLGAYQAANPDLAHLSESYELAHHMLRFGIFERHRHFANPTARNATLLTLVAKHVLEGKGKGRKRLEGRKLLEKIMHFVPSCYIANQFAADECLKRNDFTSASIFYERNLQAQQRTPAAYLNCAAAMEKIDDLAGAVRVLKDGLTAFPESVHVSETYRDYSDRFFREQWHKAGALGLTGDYSAAQELVENACDLITPSFSASRRGPIKRIAMVANMDLKQCSLYRIEQKIEQLAHEGLAVTVFDWMKEVDLFQQRITHFDAVIFYRVAGLPAITRAIVAAHNAGLVTFYEVDDLIFEPQSYPEAYDSFEGTVSLDEYVGLVIAVPAFMHALKLCDYAIGSTPILAQRMGRFCRTGKAFVHRNGFGEAHARWLSATHRPHPHDKVVLFYGSGTKAHKKDFTEILQPALEKLCERFRSKIEIVLVGYFNPTSRNEWFNSSVRVVAPVWDYQQYLGMLREADINLSVLSQSPFNEAKSEIKWLEAAMMGIPSVMSRTGTLAEACKDGEDVVLCHTAAEFFIALEKLVSDNAVRDGIGQAARRRVLAEYGLSNLGRNLAAILSSVAEQHPPKAKKIAIVNVFYPPHSIGGATRVVHDNVRDIKAMLGDSIDIEIFTTFEDQRYPYRTSSYFFEGVKVTAVSTPIEAGMDWKYSDSRMATIYEHFLERFQPNLVHFHCIQRLTQDIVSVTNRQEIPYLISVHDAWWISDHQFLYSERGPEETYHYDQPLSRQLQMGAGSSDRMRVCEASLAGAEAILAVSTKFGELYKSAGVQRVRIVENGLPDVQLRPDARPKGSRVVLAHLGGLQAHKGYKLFRYAVAAKDYENLAIIIVDHSMPPGSIRQDVWGTTPVEYVPKVPQAQVAELFARIDVLVAPSLWAESYGLVTREALAAGCWVIASDRGSIGEPVINGVNGYVVDVDGIAGLAEVLSSIDSDPKKYKCSPPLPRNMRTARDQARELIQIYRDSWRNGVGP